MLQEEKHIFQSYPKQIFANDADFKWNINCSLMFAASTKPQPLSVLFFID